MPCYKCIYSKYDKGFPECHNNFISTREKLKYNNYKLMAYKLNAFKNCEYQIKKIRYVVVDFFLDK